MAASHECEVGIARFDGVDAVFGVIVRPGPAGDLDRASAELVGTGLPARQAAAWLRHIADVLESPPRPGTDHTPARNPDPASDATSDGELASEPAAEQPTGRAAAGGGYTTVLRW
ncbi:hypothetical protein [Myceligenerans pegani]|uniref:Uncharacterized protein n=1 Tax=Myceligenerans pegani TaxID=2776917 RepID=A0ABR9N5P1_9MICO|nr:hypothetical protein [Myceligenerans sp. TRM 65318]MBE1878982.1 hypothetical protein [Myceligenerans sp. TRM 65318]MBE3021253.1 hypothetical protein [Myceligenerans sp. TRM 65318]